MSAAGHPQVALVTAIFSLLEVWEFAQAGILAGRLRGRLTRVSAALQQLARCEQQYLSMAFVERRSLSFSITGLERRLDSAAVELESCLRQLKARLTFSGTMPAPSPTLPRPILSATSTPIVRGGAITPVPGGGGGGGGGGPLLQALFTAIATCRWAPFAERVQGGLQGGQEAEPLGELRRSERAPSVTTGESSAADMALLLDMLEDAVEMVRVRQEMVVVYTRLLQASADHHALAAQVLAAQQRAARIEAPPLLGLKTTLLFELRTAHELIRAHATLCSCQLRDALLALAVAHAELHALRMHHGMHGNPAQGGREAARVQALAAAAAASRRLGASASSLKGLLKSSKPELADEPALFRRLRAWTLALMAKAHLYFHATLHAPMQPHAGHGGGGAAGGGGGGGAAAAPVPAARILSREGSFLTCDGDGAAEEGGTEGSGAGGNAGSGNAGGGGGGGGGGARDAATGPRQRRPSCGGLLLPRPPSVSSCGAPPPPQQAAQPPAAPSVAATDASPPLPPQAPSLLPPHLDFAAVLHAFVAKSDALAVALALRTERLHLHRGSTAVGGALYTSSEAEAPPTRDGGSSRLVAMATGGAHGGAKEWSQPLDAEWGVFYAHPASAHLEAIWPTVTELLRERQQLLQSFHDVYYHGNTEAGQHRSLWLCQVDPRVALVLVFAERKHAKDSSVLAFLRQICEGLRGQQILERSLLQ